MDERANGKVVEQRLRRLEREVRCFRTAVALMAGGMVAMAAMGQQEVARDALRLRRLLICDDSGAERAELSAGEDNSVSLRLLDGRERIRARLDVAGSGEPSLELFDTHAAARVSIAAAEGGGVSIALGGREGAPALRLAVSKAGVPTLDLVEMRPEYTSSLHARVERAPRLELRNWDAGPGGVLLLDARDRVRASMLTTAGGLPRLTLAGPDGEPLFAAP